jgi:hypothetical protein
MISPRRFDFSIAFTFYADLPLFSASRRRLLPFFAFALARLPAMLMLIFACHFLRFDAIISLCQRFRATPQLSPAAITLPPFCRHYVLMPYHSHIIDTPTLIRFLHFAIFDADAIVSRRFSLAA